jgi:methionyl-tRNA formyltransferase
VITTAARVAARFVEQLQALGHDVPAIVSAPTPDRPELLEQILAEAPIDVHVSRDVAHAAELLRGLDVDLGVCSGFPRKLPAEAVTAPRLGILNGHPSLLPRWRGPNPFGWTFRAGDDVFGFTWHLMDTELDTGPVLARGSTPIGDDDGVDNVFDLMRPLSAGLLAEALERLEAGERAEPQTSDGSTWAPRFEDAFAEIDWTRTAREVHNQVRSWFLPTLSGLHGAHATLGGERVKVTRSQLVGDASDAPPGTELGEGLVQCGDRPLRVLEVEPA